ncbi:uncharacterized protein TNCV_4478441 [Trichonephila clavipes]|nr:uncharacterized protein TNCV_4478441 [Trichonephila clavipes]
MIVQFKNEKVSNHGSIPITIDCNVVAFIVFEEGFHQPIKRTKHDLGLLNKPFPDQPSYWCAPVFSSTAAVAEWYRHRIVAGFVTSSSPVPLKTCRVGQRCTLNLSRAETSSRWSGVVVRRRGCQLRCRPRHLTMVQNYVVRRQKPSCS